MIDRYQLKQTLENGVATVTFEKTDGTLREMRCTLQSSFLPPQLLREEGDAKQRTTPDTLLCVWDLDAGGWRSFHVDSIKSVVNG
jgi:hypothetical protein